MLQGVNNFPGAVPVQGTGSTEATPKATTAGELSFGQLISQQLNSAELKFSAHAQARLNSRNIVLSAGDLQRLRQGVAQAAAKGARESLVLKDNVAFVVSVKNATVITAVDAQSMQGSVFTNIDSAVIV